MLKWILIGIMIVYWVPIYVYLIVWSIRIRLYVRKYKIKSLDTTHPLTYKIGKLTDFQILGEVIMYTIALFCGFLTFLAIPKNMLKDNILPDS